MKNLLHVTSFSLLMLLITANLIYAQPSGVSVDEVVSLRGGAIAVDIPTTFKINFNNDYGLSIQGFSFAFRFYITNNGEMTTAVYEPVTYNVIDVDNWTSGFTFLPVYTEEFSVDGVGADTVGIRGVESFLPGDTIGKIGLPIDFNNVVFELQTKAFTANIGDSLCIDSSIFLIPNQWHWHTEGNVRYEDVPWTGPHCFEIVEKCCVGIRGNVNVSSDEAIDISDLVELVAFMFQDAPTPPCPEETNIDGIGIVDISDLVAMVAYMFQGGVEPAPCL